MKIAVYGTLRKGHSNHGCLMGSPMVGETTLKGFSMVSLGGFPAIDYKAEGSILAEVYECSEGAVARCNMLEGYDPNSNDNNFYDRVAVETEYGEAQVYIMRGVLDGELYERIESGDWENYVEQKRAAYAA